MRIAAYCRVSTDREEQKDSLAHQKEFFLDVGQQIETEGNGRKKEEEKEIRNGTKKETARSRRKGGKKG